MSVSRVRAVRRSMSCASNTAPVGLCGVLTMIMRVLPLMAAGHFVPVDAKILQRQFDRYRRGACGRTIGA